MTLALEISLLSNLTVKSMLEQKNIPCFCKVGGNHFELAFQHPLPAAVGKVTGWSTEMVDARAPAGGGGPYTHYCFATVTLEKTAPDFYRILDLSFFNEISGWCPIVVEGTLAAPKPIHSQAEIDEIDAMFKDKKLTKKQKRTLGAKDNEPGKSDPHR
ncbi:hypothetical protein [Variovorax sp. CF313]|uniref:hypothetical protein n=1 Tax=Variovorax sp. CF313 TaxID=1144315 RepID=UPI0012F814DE|nr:hypothetical protein [Variovorax sp. CF313]